MTTLPPDMNEHATTLAVVGLSASLMLALTLIGIARWAINRLLGALTKIEESIAKIWTRLDTMGEALHIQGKSLAKLWGAHEARSACGPSSEWPQRQGYGRRKGDKKEEE